MTPEERIEAVAPIKNWPRVAKLAAQLGYDTEKAEVPVEFAESLEAEMADSDARLAELWANLNRSIEAAKQRQLDTAIKEAE